MLFHATFVLTQLVWHELNLVNKHENESNGMRQTKEMDTRKIKYVKSLSACLLQQRSRLWIEKFCDFLGPFSCRVEQ